MVELSAGAAAAIAAGAGALVLCLVVALVAASRRWRAASRRLAAVATRLEVPGSPPGDDRDSVGCLERLAEAAVLRASEAHSSADRLAAALDQLGQGVVVCDEHGTLVYRNERAASLAGAGPDGEPADPVTVGAVTEVLSAGVRGESDSRTVELLSPPRRTLGVAGHPVDDGRRVVGAVAVIDDISERRRFEAIRRDFLANVTAELKGPVGALGLLAGTIVAEDDPALTRRLARRLEQDALRVGRIIDDLAELSRLDAAALPPREPVPVHLLVAQAVEEVRSLALHRTVSIDAGEAPPTIAVECDRRPVVSALRHLVENAVKFSGAAGEGAPVKIKVGVDGAWVDIAVRDRGPGIPAGDLDRIFECFYRSERVPGRPAAGTGIGLAIASQVAAVHGGEVQVSSREGRGSTFTLRLPVAGAVRSAPARAAG